jgi:hypothetical protein
MDAVSLFAASVHGSAAKIDDATGEDFVVSGQERLSEDILTNRWQLCTSSSPNVFTS